MSGASGEGGGDKNKELYVRGQKIMRTRTWCAAGTAAAIAILAGCGTAGTQPTSGSSAANSAPTASSVAPPGVAVNTGPHDTTDVEFASALGQLGGQGQSMAALAQDRADHPALTGLAAEVQQRAQDIDTMHAWLRDWDQPSTPVTTVTDPGMLTSDDIQALSAQRGGEFEDAWLEHMAGNYTAAIAWCQRELDQGANPQARDLAARWLTAMNHELSSVQQWHSEWGHHPQPAPASMPAQPAPQPTTSTSPSGAGHSDDSPHMTETTHQDAPHPGDGLHASEAQHQDGAGHMDDSRP
ncbi:MAG TPA: DUF305 domain-containing protein [Nakamurella sp.]